MSAMPDSVCSHSLVNIVPEPLHEHSIAVHVLHLSSMHRSSTHQSALPQLSIKDTLHPPSGVHGVRLRQLLLLPRCLFAGRLLALAQTQAHPHPKRQATRQPAAIITKC